MTPILTEDQFQFLQTKNTQGEEAAIAEASERITSALKAKFSNLTPSKETDGYISLLAKKDTTDFRLAYNEAIDLMAWKRARKEK